MKYISIFIILFFSCNEKKASLPIENKEKSWSKTFILENDSVNQTLFCNDPKNGKIEFAIAIENSKTHKKIKLNGFATTRDNFDGEVDEDQNGEAYFCQEYFYDDNLKIRLDSEEGNKARVVSNNNKEISGELMRLR